MLVVLGMLLALVVITALTRDDATFAAPLDPRNPERDGAQAVARVLADRGVDLRVLRGEPALLDERVDAGTTVVVTNPDELGVSTLDRLQDHAGDAGAVVLVGDAAVLGGLLGIGTGDLDDGNRPAACEDPLTRGLTLRSRVFEGLEARGCFGSSGTSLLVHRADLWLMVAPHTLSNEHILERDNAALTLRLLGQEERLLWYVADPADIDASDGVSLGSLLPPWLLPSLGLVLAGLLALMLLQGRRLGPLVSEPLPVVVRAAESTQSRGRIYRRTGDRGHAATILVGATRRRLLTALQLPAGSPTQTLAAAVAARTGRDEREVHDLLEPPVVVKDSHLVEVGRDLIELENEVRGS